MSLGLAEDTFAGVTVVDLTRLFPGPFCTMLFADLGARVIKIEAPMGGDYARWYAPILDETDGCGYGAFFQSINRGKESLAVNMKTPEGVALVRDLIAKADVVMESFRPGVLERLGLGIDEMRAANPKLIVCSITGYGRTGPLASRAGHDLNYVARAGVLSVTGPLDGVPPVLGVQVADIAGGALYAAFGVAAALFRRSNTGKGAHLDISMTEGAMSLVGPVMNNFASTGTLPERGGDILTGGLACYRVYETKDGRHLSVGALEPKFWMAFCNAAGRPDLLGDAMQMGKDAPAAQARVAALVAEKTLAEWTALLGPADACCEPVLTLAEALEDEHFKARSAIRRDGDQVVAVPPTSPRDGALAPAPRLGQHTTQILAELGRNDEAVSALIAAGAIPAAAANSAARGTSAS